MVSSQLENGLSGIDQRLKHGDSLAMNPNMRYRNQYRLSRT